MFNHSYVLRDPDSDAEYDIPAGVLSEFRIASDIAPKEQQTLLAKRLDAARCWLTSEKGIQPSDTSWLYESLENVGSSRQEFLDECRQLKEGLLDTPSLLYCREAVRFIWWRMSSCGAEDDLPEPTIKANEWDEVDRRTAEQAALQDIAKAMKWAAEHMPELPAGLKRITSAKKTNCAPPNEDRDRYFYERWLESWTGRQIFRSQNRDTRWNSNWTKVANAQQIRPIVVRYCNRHELAVPLPRKKGRPKKSK